MSNNPPRALIFFEKKYERLAAREELLYENLNEKEISLEVEQDELEELTQVRYVLTEVSRHTQEQFKLHIESLVTMAIESVFIDRKFVFVLKFEHKSNRIVCEPLIMENGEEFKPKDELGGGIIDIISFALRIVLWTMENPQKRNTLIFDEPFKFTGKLSKLAGRMMQELSHKLNIQIIMITHDDTLTEIADRAWHVDFDGKISTVIEL